MRTIQKITSYNLSAYEISCLLESEIINWCWWKNSFSFDKILKDNLQLIPGFDTKKSEELYQDIKIICFEHDIDFRFWIWFFKANFNFWKKIFKLLYWAKFSYRLSIALICFILLMKHWKKFYFVKN